MTFYSSGKVSRIVELNIRIIDIGPYCYEDNDFFQNEFKKTKIYLRYIENPILEKILKISFENINLVFYENKSLYFKKQLIQMNY